MKKTPQAFPARLKAASLVSLVLGLVLFILSLSGCAPPPLSETSLPASSQLPEEAAPSQTPALAEVILSETPELTATLPEETPSPPAYPPPGEATPTPAWTEEVEPLPTPTAELSPFPLTPPFPFGQAAVLHNDDAWLVEYGRQPLNLTRLGDVSALFGWDRTGSRLLFGRGRFQQVWGYTTDLWVVDRLAGVLEQLTYSDLVRTASWSPLGDSYAVCENGGILSIFSLGGDLLNRIEQIICDFTWSPDGTAIAVGAYTLDMYAGDGLYYSVLAIWWLQDNRLQLLSDAKDEAQSWPIWSLDSQKVLFQRYFFDAQKQGVCWLHVFDRESGEIRPIEFMEYCKVNIMRSPKADVVAFKRDIEFYVTDFEGRYELIGQGNYLTWLSDGKTLLFLDLDGNFNTHSLEIETRSEESGGLQHSQGIYPPEYPARPIFVVYGGENP